MFDPQPPDLPTFSHTPSWCNRNRRIDRSACLEVRVGEVRRITRPAFTEHRHRPTKTPRTRRLATALVTLTVHDLLAMHERRRPRRLAGDWRTDRAIAMRNDGFDRTRGFRNRAPRNATSIRQHAHNLPANPNHGAAATKLIGIREINEQTWTHPIRLEKWRFATRRLPGYYLICPGTFIARNRHVGDDVRRPPLSTAPPGRKAVGCPQRCHKLLMPLCTRQELLDALAAWSWINAIPATMTTQCRHAVTELTERYGVLFPPRTLLCARCLNVQYGNDPETSRQNWRRAAGKSDARPPKRQPTRRGRTTRRPGR